MDPWEHILCTLPPTDEKVTYVTADTMKKAKETWKGGANQFEPRLLCYQTSDDARPSPLKRRGLYVLPVKNGTYALVRTSIYQPISYEVTTPEILIQPNRDSLLLGMGQSEMSLIDNLRYAGVFERPELLGEPILYGSLLGGRHRTGAFSMLLGDQTLKVEGVQYEIDSAYESKHAILLLEGKSCPKPIDSFNIRQLYYPFRAIKANVNDKKRILCGFVHQLKGVIHIWVYDFENVDRMDSIRLLSHNLYRFSSE